MKESLSPQHRTVYGNDVPKGQFTCFFESLKYYLAGMGPRILTKDLVLYGHAREGERNPVMWDVVANLAGDMIRDSFHTMVMTPAHWCEMIASYMRNYRDAFSVKVINDEELMHGVIKDKKLFYNNYMLCAWRQEFIRKQGVVKSPTTIAEWRENLLKSKVATDFENSRTSYWRVMDTVKAKEPTHISDMDYFIPYFLGKTIAKEHVHFRQNRVQPVENRLVIQRNLLGVKFRSKNCLEEMGNYIVSAATIRRSFDPYLEFDKLVKEKYVFIEGRSNFDPYVIHATVGAGLVSDFISRYIKGTNEMTSAELARKILEKIPGAQKAYDNERKSLGIRRQNQNIEEAIEGKKPSKLTIY